MRQVPRYSAQRETGLQTDMSGQAVLASQRAVLCFTTRRSQHHEPQLSTWKFLQSLLLAMDDALFLHMRRSQCLSLILRASALETWTTVPKWPSVFLHLSFHCLRLRRCAISTPLTRQLKATASPAVSMKGTAQSNAIGHCGNVERAEPSTTPNSREAAYRRRRRRALHQQGWRPRNFSPASWQTPQTVWGKTRS